MTRIATFSGLTAFAALACLAADDTGAAAAQPAPASPIAEFEFPNLDGKQSFDCSTIPADTRLDFLKNGVRAYIANRLNSAHTRHQKDEKVAAWFAYDEATKADPLQTAVAKPEGERPGEPDYKAVYDRAVTDLQAGNVRKVGSEPKAKKTKDPLIVAITGVVERELFDSRRATDPKYSFLTARKEVGGDGLAYLNAMIEEKVAGGADRAALEKTRDERYVTPAKTMLGQTVAKKNEGLPSIL